MTITIGENSNEKQRDDKEAGIATRKCERAQRRKKEASTVKKKSKDDKQMMREKTMIKSNEKAAKIKNGKEIEQSFIFIHSSSKFSKIRRMYVR